PDINLLREVYETELIHHFPKLQETMDIDLPNSDEKAFKITSALKLERRITEITDDKDIYNLYILIKGLLHRLNHSTSAHFDIDVDSDEDSAALTKKYIYKDFS